MHVSVFEKEHKPPCNRKRQTDRRKGADDKIDVMYYFAPIIQSWLLVGVEISLSGKSPYQWYNHPLKGQARSQGRRKYLLVSCKGLVIFLLCCPWPVFILSQVCV